MAAYNLSHIESIPKSKFRLVLRLVFSLLFAALMTFVILTCFSALFDEVFGGLGQNDRLSIQELDRTTTDSVIEYITIVFLCLWLAMAVALNIRWIDRLAAFVLVCLGTALVFVIAAFFTGATVGNLLDMTDAGLVRMFTVGSLVAAFMFFGGFADIIEKDRLKYSSIFQNMLGAPWRILKRSWGVYDNKAMHEQKQRENTVRRVSTLIEVAQGLNERDQEKLVNYALSLVQNE